VDGSLAEHHKSSGAVYVSNPREYRVKFYKFGSEEGWRYDPRGEPISALNELMGDKLGFVSRKDLVELGESIFAKEGCWYCHTDQTRTLVQDTILNGSESFPAPPSSNEYIYQKVTFPGTRRIGLDISRVGVKRPSRDWHKSHFWSPKTASVGTIMPAFRHFFDDDPRGTSNNPYRVPNYKFEAVFQYLMTKGTRITPPTQSWWTGRDPIRTIDIIEGRGGAS
jgi:cytochrome c oxidase cbb3-type subunit 2